MKTTMLQTHQLHLVISSSILKLICCLFSVWFWEFCVTCVCSEPQAPTPALVNPNDVLDDDEDEPLNGNDDDDDLDVGEDDELNTKHLVLAQFDKVYHTHVYIIITTCISENIHN